MSMLMKTSIFRTFNSILMIPVLAGLLSLTACTPADRNGNVVAPDSEIIPEITTPAGDVLTEARNAGSFNTFLAAVDSAGLSSTLSGIGPFTIFAPTDAAFNKLPAGTVEDWLKPENREHLRAVLEYHIVNGQILATDVVTLSEITTRNGAAIGVTSGGSGVVLNDKAVVTQTDIKAANGIIHAVDTVLEIPK